MSKILTFFLSLTFLFFFSCGDAPACTNISWGDTSSTNEMEPVLMYSAGTNCSNYGDYYDEDLGSAIENIKRMKFIKSGECRDDLNSDAIVDCPDFLPETIEIGKMIGCRFDTPPDANTDCAYGSISLFFETNDERFNKSEVRFSHVNKLVFYEGGNSGDELMNFLSDDGEIFLVGFFSGEEEFKIYYIWTEEGEEKRINALYTVEISD